MTTTLTTPSGRRCDDIDYIEHPGEHANGTWVRDGKYWARYAPQESGKCYDILIDKDGSVFFWVQVEWDQHGTGWIYQTTLEEADLETCKQAAAAMYRVTGAVKHLTAHAP